MGFQSINKVENAQKMLDAAFSKAKKVNIPKGKLEPLAWARKREAARLDAMNEKFHGVFKGIIKDFPAFDNLNEFYSELLRISLDFDELKKSLGAVHWADGKAKELVINHKRRLFAAKSPDAIHKEKKAYMGRISSVIAQIDENLKFLESSRRILKEFPVIKELPTVCIAGFPNVGKSTLLGKITTSKPEIQSYAFTTKTLNLGYFMCDKSKIQVIDTPGTLARPEKMNNIEKQAYLAIKYQADLIVYVFDPTDTYSNEDQDALLELIKSFKKPIIIYLSKTDIASEEKIIWFKKKYELLDKPDELKAEIEKQIDKE